MYPSREMIEGAVRIGTISTEYHGDAEKVWLTAATVKILVKAARWALKLVDEANPPALEEDERRAKRRPVRRGFR